MMAEFVAVFLRELVFRMLLFLFFNIDMAGLACDLIWPRRPRYLS